MDVRCFSSPRDRRLSLCSASAARHPRRNSLLLPSHAKANAKAKAANPPARRTLRHHPPPTRVTNHHASLPTTTTTATATATATAAATASLISLSLPCTSLRQASRRPTSSRTLPLQVFPPQVPDPLDRRRRPPEEPRPPLSLCICGVCTSCPPGLQPRRYTFTATHLAHRYIASEVSLHSRTHSTASCHATSLRLHASNLRAVSFRAASRAYDHVAGIA